MLGALVLLPALAHFLLKPAVRRADEAAGPVAPVAHADAVRFAATAPAGQAARC
jgi:hypothetical protein